MSIKLNKTDPAYWMLDEGLNNPDKVKEPEVYKPGCFICEDPEFALMGLPLCTKCKGCSGHVPADSSICDNCGEDQDDLE